MRFTGLIIDLDTLKSFVLQVLTKHLPVMNHRYRSKKLTLLARHEASRPKLLYHIKAERIFKIPTIKSKPKLSLHCTSLCMNYFFLKIRQSTGFDPEMQSTHNLNFTQESAALPLHYKIHQTMNS